MDGVTRIVAGTAGGRRLAVPPDGTRPTSDRVREALFSALDARVGLAGVRVLDLYAGSGALGFEALSRGATHTTFVEAGGRAADVLRRNATDLGLSGAEIRHGSVSAVLATPPTTPYHVVLADPPYAVGEDELAAMLTDLAGNGWTVPGASLVVERSARSGAPRWPTPFEALRAKRYGDTVLHWAEHREPG